MNEREMLCCKGVLLHVSPCQSEFLEMIAKPADCGCLSLGTAQAPYLQRARPVSHRSSLRHV